MAQRLVTPEDLAKYPQLKSQGVSANQHYDFSALEQQPTSATAPSAEEQVQREADKKLPGKKK